MAVSETLKTRMTPGRSQFIDMPEGNELVMETGGEEYPGGLWQGTMPGEVDTGKGKVAVLETVTQRRAEVELFNGSVDSAERSHQYRR